MTISVKPYNKPNDDFNLKPRLSSATSQLSLQIRPSSSDAAFFTPSASNSFKTFAYSPRELSASNIKNNLKNKGVLQDPDRDVPPNDPAQDNEGLEDINNSNGQIILKDRVRQKGVRDIPKDPDRDVPPNDPAQDNEGLEDINNSNGQIFLKDLDRQNGVSNIPKDPDRDDPIKDPAQDNEGLEDINNSNAQIILKDLERRKGVPFIPNDPDRDVLTNDPAQDNVGL